MKNSFTHIIPQTLDQEIFRQKLVFTLILIAVPIVGILLIWFKNHWKSIFHFPGNLILITATLALVYAFIEPFLLKFNYKEFSVDKTFNSFTVAHISDIHFQWPYKYVTKDKLMKIVNKVNEFEPDFIFLTGDFISRFRTKKISEYNIENIASALSLLKAKRGVFAILGNNDRCAKEMLPDAFAKYGIKILRNETVLLDDIAISGIESCKNDTMTERRLSATQKIDAPLRILLAHEPDTASITNPYFDLQFSGHTHGGQCVAPFGIGPIISPKYGKKYPLGLYKVGNMLLHVTTGVGISPLPKPLVRFNNIASVDFLKITPSK